MKKYSKFSLLLICLTLVLSMSLNAFAASSIAGQGVGVSDSIPSSSGQISTRGTQPPSSSAQTVDLDKKNYNGSVTWASATLYTDKWVKTTNSTTINIYADFGMYATKDDAINRTNPLSNTSASIPVYLIDSKGKAIGPKYFSTNGGLQSISFTVTAGTDYYAKFNFNTGYYESGEFAISID